MKLKIVSWNMGHWLHQSVSQKAWEFLEKSIAPDIMLLQEAMPPLDRRTETCLWKEIGGRRNWGSGVLTKNLALKEIDIKNDYPGSLVVTDIILPDGSILVVISMYGLMDEHGYAITTLHRMLSDLTHLIDGKFRAGGRPKIILGGDLNASPQWDDKYGTKTHRIFFDRLEAFGLVDCQGIMTEGRPRTLRHSRSTVPWVNDYIFASESLAKKVISHEIIESSEMNILSDHNPVVVTFDI
jgi:exonuclease III